MSTRSHYRSKQASKKNLTPCGSSKSVMLYASTSKRANDGILADTYSFNTFSPASKRLAVSKIPRQKYPENSLKEITGLGSTSMDTISEVPRKGTF